MVLRDGWEGEVMNEFGTRSQKYPDLSISIISAVFGVAIVLLGLVYEDWTGVPFLIIGSVLLLGSSVFIIGRVREKKGKR